MLKRIKNSGKILYFVYEIMPKINIKLLVTFISLIFIGSSIISNFDDLASQTINSRKLIWLSSGIFFSFFSIIINAYAWKFLINSIGCNTNKLNLIEIFLNTNIYKYLPGGIWHLVSRYKTLRVKYSTEKSVESILLEPLLMLVAGLIFVPFGTPNIFIYILCWSSPLLFLSGFRKVLIKKMKTIKYSIFAKGNSENYITLNQKKNNEKENILYPYKPLFIEILFILFRFFGFFCCVKAFYVSAIILSSKLISSFSLAWIIGLIVPAAPGGIGVFESVILFGLGSHVPEAPLLASLLCYRVISTISDVAASFVYPVKRLLKDKNFC